MPLKMLDQSDDEIVAQICVLLIKPAAVYLFYDFCAINFEHTTNHNN